VRRSAKDAGTECRADFNGRPVWGKWDRDRGQIVIWDGDDELMVFDDDTDDEKIVGLFRRLASGIRRVA
jgi:hypothetical protein